MFSLQRTLITPKALKLRGASTKTTRRIDKKRDSGQQLRLAQHYADLYVRIPANPTLASLHKEFGDKEIRVLMSINGILINDVDSATGYNAPESSRPYPSMRHSSSLFHL